MIFGTPRCVPRKAVDLKTQLRADVLRPIGQQIHRLRIEQDLTQERLAELAGVNPKHLGRIERGDAEPCAGLLVRLARALGVTVGDLFETITPAATAPPRLSPPDLSDITAAANTIISVVDRMRSRQPRALPSRARRRKTR